MRHKNRKNFTQPDRVEFGYSFQIGEGLWERMGVDVSLKPGETIEDKLAEMQERLLQFHKKTNPQLYQTGNEAIVRGFGNNGGGEKVINRVHERLALLIDDCTTLEQLKEYEKDLPPELFLAYHKKENELMDKAIF